MRGGEIGGEIGGGRRGDRRVGERRGEAQHGSAQESHTAILREDGTHG